MTHSEVPFVFIVIRLALNIHANSMQNSSSIFFSHMRFLLLSPAMAGDSDVASKKAPTGLIVALPTELVP